MPEKTCTACGEMRPTSAFYRNGNYLMSQCKDCIRAKQRARYEADPEKFRERSRENYRKDPTEWNRRVVESARKNREARRASQRRYEQSARGQEMHGAQQRIRQERKRLNGSVPYSREEIFRRDRGICYLCGLPINAALPTQHPMAFVLDHKIPLSSGGPDTPENVGASHRRCNDLKGVRQYS